MKTVFSITILALTGSLVWQVFQNSQMPEPDQNLLQNEIGFYRAVNDFAGDRINSSCDYILQHTTLSLPESTECINSAKTVRNAWAQMLTVANVAIMQKNDIDYVNGCMDSLKGIYDQIPNPEAIQNLLNEFDTSDITSYGSVELNTLTSVNTLLNNYNILLDYMVQECTPTYCGFDTMAAMIRKKIGKAHINDSLTTVIPQTMTTGETKRIRISFSKKLVDKLIDTLNFNTALYIHPSGLVNVTLVDEDDLQLFAFNEPEQVVSRSKYSIWEYNLRAASPGKKNLKLQLKVMLIDIDGKDRCETVEVPLQKIVVE
jgi:hypothetical protein